MQFYLIFFIWLWIWSAGGLFVQKVSIMDVNQQGEELLLTFDLSGPALIFIL
jgi:hypothetical protein